MAVEFRVSEVVEADAAEPGSVEEGAEAAGEVGRVERPSSRRGEDEAAVTPGRPGLTPFPVLPFLVLLEGGEAFGGDGDAAFGCPGFGGQVGEAAGLRLRWSERRMLGVSPSRSRPFQRRPRSSPLPEAGAQGSDSRGAAVLTFRATLRGSSSSRTECSKVDLRSE